MKQMGLNIPLTREAKTEMYKNELEVQRKREKTKGMSKKEREQEQKARAAALHKIAGRPKTAEPRTPKKGSRGPDEGTSMKSLVDSIRYEDPLKWEQVSQAGCTFWRNIETREIRLFKPAMKGSPAGELQPIAKYPLGTGSTLYDVADFSETRSWLCERGMALPQLVPQVKKPPPTAEEIQTRRRHYSARAIQRQARRKVEWDRQKSMATSGGSDASALLESTEEDYGDDDYYDDDST